jgi:hypothetical protein
VQASRADQTAFQRISIQLCNQKKRYDQDKENNAQHNRNPKERAFNATTGSENTASIGTCQPAQACALALYDNAQDEQDRDYNQRNI